MKGNAPGSDKGRATTGTAGKNPLDSVRPSRIVWPVLIGLLVVGWMFYRDFDPKVFDSVHFTWGSVFWLFMAVMFMVGRDLGYIIRIRVLSRGALTWKKAFRVIMLWEATSAITPSAVGGTSVAILYVHKEGIGLGKSSAIVMLTSFLDELYFAIMFPLLIWIVSAGNLFNISLQSGGLETGLKVFALTGYFLKLAWVLLLAYGLFINPKGFKWLLEKVFGLRFLRRWRESASKVGDEIIESSKEIKGSSFGFWMKAFWSTFLSWSSRYLVANALIMAFFAVSDQFLLFARQLVMWIMMLIMPTPGGSGFAEIIFSKYCADLISVPLAMQVSAATLIAFLWRGVTYYPYLIAGAIIFPNWLKRSFKWKKKGEKEEEEEEAKTAPAATEGDTPQS